MTSLQPASLCFVVPLPCMQVVLKVIQPYTRVRIAFIAQQLNVPAADVERLLINLILDKRVDGNIDQVGAPSCWHGVGVGL